MQPATSDRTTWKHWATAFVTLTFLTIGMPLIVSLPTPGAAATITLIAAGIIFATRKLARSNR